MPLNSNSFAKTGELLAVGNSNAHNESGPDSYDVWTHTGSGVAENGSEFLQDPCGTMTEHLNGRLAQLGALAPGQWHSTSFGDAKDAVVANAEGVSDAFNQLLEADNALEGFAAAFGTLTALEQMLSAGLSTIPFPALPAVRIMDNAIGLPHAHMHPPNLTPPNPAPVPLPCAGPVIPIPLISGAGSVLINNMPAARCGDLGLSVWCGGYFPMYEIFLGSSSVWMEGSRSARLAVDITMHCIFSAPTPTTDLPVGPPMGATATSSFNVIVGGVPMPSLTGMAMGKAFGAVFKGFAKVAGLAKSIGKVGVEVAEVLSKSADDLAREAAEAASKAAKKAATEAAERAGKAAKDAAVDWAKNSVKNAAKSAAKDKLKEAAFKSIKKMEDWMDESAKVGDDAAKNSDELVEETAENAGKADEAGDAADNAGNATEEAGGGADEAADAIDEAGDTADEAAGAGDEAGDAADETAEAGDEAGDAVDETAEAGDEAGDAADDAANDAADDAADDAPDDTPEDRGDGDDGEQVLIVTLDGYVL